MTKKEHEIFTKKLNFLLLGEGERVNRSRIKDICWNIFLEGKRYGESLTYVKKTDETSQKDSEIDNISQ